ncbi:GTP-binding protein [Candidatus Woesebacteria bacterium]|nr:MAG: GTP-binding protein [Candidatus Woesebacteria bacterium]
MKDQKPINPASWRPPVVSVLGHVDHGKTTLLDAIRRSNVANKEAGGITQSIGASTVTTKDGKQITFIDTPGHAVFNKMRSTGANVANVVVLVVAADDGVKPQTKEAIKYIKEAQVPFIVALTKIDLPGANVEKTKSELVNEQIMLDGFGGDVPVVLVSGKTGIGLDELLDMIILVSQMNETKEDNDPTFKAVIIETGKDKSGPIVSLVVKNGTLSIGDVVYSSSYSGKVKGMFDQHGKSVVQATPGQAVGVLGFSSLPPVGSIVTLDSSNNTKVVDRINANIEIAEGQIPVIIKTKSAGSLEAIEAHLPSQIVVVSSGVGDVTESDIFAAKSAKSSIFTFESKVPGGTLKLARTEGVIIEEFKIIYKLFERLEEIILKGQIVILGKAKILAEFPFDHRKVAGSKVTEGRIAKSDTLIVYRNDIEVGKSRIDSMRKEKNIIDVARQGEEFGIIFSDKLDFKPGDMVVSVRKH